MLKAWRTLNKNYRQLQEDYDKLNIRHNLTVQEHQETLSQRAEEYRAALEQADQRGAIVTTMTKRHGRQKEKH